MGLDPNSSRKHSGEDLDYLEYLEDQISVDESVVDNGANKLPSRVDESVGSDNAANKLGPSLVDIQDNQDNQDPNKLGPSLVGFRERTLSINNRPLKRPRRQGSKTRFNSLNLHSEPYPYIPYAGPHVVS